jgi:hypothetical protein
VKREGHIYLLIGLIIAGLLFFQYNPFNASAEKPVSEVRPLSGFSRMLLDVNCNIFFVEGDNPGIVYEGPEKLVRNLNIDVKEGCLIISNKHKNLSNIFKGWLYPGQTELLNIYVVVKDINTIDIRDLIKNAGSSEILDNRMKIIVNNNSKIIIGINTTNQKV